MMRRAFQVLELGLLLAWHKYSWGLKIDAPNLELLSSAQCVISLNVYDATATAKSPEGECLLQGSLPWLIHNIGPAHACGSRCATPTIDPPPGIWKPIRPSPRGMKLLRSPTGFSQVQLTICSRDLLTRKARGLQDPTPAESFWWLRYGD